MAASFRARACSRSTELARHGLQSSGSPALLGWSEEEVVGEDAARVLRTTPDGAVAGASLIWRSPRTMTVRATTARSPAGRHRLPGELWPPRSAGRRGHGRRASPSRMSPQASRVETQRFLLEATAAPGASLIARRDARDLLRRGAGAAPGDFCLFDVITLTASPATPPARTRTRRDKGAFEAAFGCLPQTPSRPRTCRKDRTGESRSLSASTIALGVRGRPRVFQGHARPGVRSIMTVLLRLGERRLGR